MNVFISSNTVLQFGVGVLSSLCRPQNQRRPWENKI